jgi:hypothetical protein
VHCGDCSDGNISVSGESDRKEVVCICIIPDSRTMGILQLCLQDLKEILEVRFTTWNRITSLGPLWGI